MRHPPAANRHGFGARLRDAEAAREFRAAIPILMAAARENADDDIRPWSRAQPAAALSSKPISRCALAQPRGRADVAIETFALADAIRGRSVQQALTASSARAAEQGPGAGRTRAPGTGPEQAGQRAAWHAQQCAGAAVRPARREGVQALSGRSSCAASATSCAPEIAKRFPSYANLIDPKPPSVDQIKAALSPTRRCCRSISAATPALSGRCRKTASRVRRGPGDARRHRQRRSAKLRKALEPDGHDVSDIPPFDLELAYDLYACCSSRSRAGWKPAKT